MNLSNSALMGVKPEISAADGNPAGSGNQAGPALAAAGEKKAENFRQALAHASNRGQTRQAPEQTTEQPTHPSAQQGKSAPEGKQKNNAQPAAGATSGRSKAEANLQAGSGDGSRVSADPGGESDRSAINGLRRLLAALDSEGGPPDSAESAKALLSWLDDLKEQSGEGRAAGELQQLIRLINGGGQTSEASLGLLGGKSKEGPAAGILTGENRPGGNSRAGKSALLAQLQQILAANPAAGKAGGAAADLTSSRTGATDAANGKALQNMLDQLRQLLVKDGAQSTNSQETTKTAAERDQNLKEQLRQIFESREKASVQTRQAGAADTEKTAGGDLHGRLKQFFQQAETGKTHGGQGKDSQAAATDAEKSAGRDLQAQLRQLFQQTETGKTREGQGRDAQAAASLANATEGRRTPETDGRSTLRQLLNDLAERTAAEEKGAGSGKAKEALADLKAGLKNTDAGKGDLEQLLRGLNAEKSGAKPSALTEAGGKTADLTGQTQTGSQSNEKAAAPSAPARQTGAPSFDRALQNAENRVVSQVFVRLFSGARQGSGNMTINMHPPELGSVKVRITSESGHLNVSLHPQNHQVVGILERHLPTLQQSLADQGLDISDLQVSVDSGGEEGKSRFEEQAFDGRQHRASKMETADAEAEALAEPQAAGGFSESGLSLRV